MKNSNNKKIPVIPLCGLVSSTLLLGTLSLQAQSGSDAERIAGSKTTTRALSSQNAQSDQKDPATCIREAAKMNMATIKFGQLAEQKAENPQLKAFGRMLAQDHQRAEDRLEKIARKQSVTLPTTLDAKCESELSKLRELNGTAFDQEFTKGALEGHAQAAAELQKAQGRVQDSELSQYTKDMLKEVQDHQRQARQIAAAVGIDQATITSLENKAPEGVGAPGSEAESGKSKETDKSKPAYPIKN